MILFEYDKKYEMFQMYLIEYLHYQLHYRVLFDALLLWKQVQKLWLNKFLLMVKKICMGDG